MLSAAETKRDRKKRDKADRIRAAALALLRERGFEATTTRDIAARAGIAAGTLFLYVPRKEDLLDFVFTGEIERVVEAAFASLPTGAGLIEILMHPFARLIDFYAADLPLARVLLREGVLPAAAARSVPLTVGFVHRLSEEIARAGVTDPLPVEGAMHAFMLYIGAVLTLANGHMDAGGAKQLLARALEVHFRRPA